MTTETHGGGIVVSPEAADAIEFLDAFLARLSSAFSGTATLNEIRVGHTVMIRVLTGRTTTNTSLSKELGISKATVSRAVLRLIEFGVYRETVHPDDRRQRVLSLTDQGREIANDWLDWISQKLPD